MKTVTKCLFAVQLVDELQRCHASEAASEMLEMSTDGIVGPFDLEHQRRLLVDNNHEIELTAVFAGGER